MPNSNLPHFIQSNVDLKQYNTWRTGGNAEFFVTPQTLEEYKESILWALQNKLAITFLGQGSNTLISDKGLSGLVLCSKKFQEVEIHELNNELELICQSGALKYKVMRIFLKYNLAPALFLSGIPGDVGGGVVMNAGVSENIVPKEFCEIVKSIKVLTWDQNSFEFQIKEFKNNEIKWAYRSSKNWQPGFIFEVVLSSVMTPVSDMVERVKTAINNRKLKQPWDKPSCGSVFVNPPNHKSGQLIEESELKGFQIGGAQVSYKHANFIVNTGTATSQDIHRVIEEVKSKVFDKFKVSLHTEVVYLGPWDHLEK